MAYLYQEIMNVPGLTGTWKERNRQLYEMLGSPQGAYKGSYEQNINLLNQLKKNNYFKSGLPGQAPAQTAPAPAVTEKPLSRTYTDPLTGQLKTASEIPQFENLVGDYEKVWNERLAPGVQVAGESQINPEAQRQFKDQYTDYMYNLTNRGGQRFGRGLKGLGDLRASAERNRLATLQDWMGQQKGGIQNLWYEPTVNSWNEARMQVKPGEDMPDYTIPTAEEAIKQYGTAYGVGESSSPFYG